MARRISAVLLFCASLASGLTANAQQSTGGESKAPTSAGVAERVTVEPELLTLQPGESKRFTATVSGTGSYSAEVYWSVNGVKGGNTALGTISDEGLYVTPYPTPAAVTVTATSTADPSKLATAVVTLMAPKRAAGPALVVDAGKATHAISPLIYGMNAYRDSDPQQAPQVASAVRLPLLRWGGESLTRYNYQLDISNLGDDWFFELVPNLNTKFPDESEFNSQVIQGRAAGAKVMGMMPVMGWVAKTRTRSASFSVAKYGAQQKTDPTWPDSGNGVRPDGTRITNNDPNDTCMPVDATWAAEWVKYLVGRFGDAAHGGVAIYALDNEPTWWSRVHRDVHPLPFTYDEVTENGLKVARAIKSADPTAEVSGPVIDFWLTYFYSGTDLQSIQEHWMDPAQVGLDRKAHGNVPLIEYYLRAFKAAQDADAQHTRFLDYLDLHTYFAANNAGLKPAGTSQQQRAVLESTRVFWDPTYTDQQYRDPDNFLAALAPEMIPRMKRWVAANYPGTKTAISEYNWGGAEHISGAVAEADILGIFGREGLDLGALWGPPNLNTPLLYAFKMFRNYDDAGGEFGDVSLAATSAGQDKLAIYAARRTADGVVTVVVINKTFGDLTAPVMLEGFKPKGKAMVYQYSGADLGQIRKMPDVKPVRGRLQEVFPAMSITLFAIGEK